MKLFENLKGSKVIGTIVALVVGILIGGLSMPPCSDPDHEGVEEELKTQEQTLLDKDEELKDKEEELKDKEEEIQALNAKIESAKPWFDKTEEEQKAIEEENAKIEAERLAKEKEEKKKAEEEAAKKAEEEKLAKEEAEKNKYENGPTYNEVARNPDDYMMKLGKFKGEVIQLMEGETYNNLRVAVGGNYDNILFVEYDPSILSQRILEGDQVTIYGANMGICSYESTMGATISIPAMLADKIDIN